MKRFRLLHISRPIISTRLEHHNNILSMLVWLWANKSHLYFNPAGQMRDEFCYTLRCCRSEVTTLFSWAIVGDREMGSAPLFSSDNNKSNCFQRGPIKEPAWLERVSRNVQWEKWPQDIESALYNTFPLKSSSWTRRLDCQGIYSLSGGVLSPKIVKSRSREIGSHHSRSRTSGHYLHSSGRGL